MTVIDVVVGAQFGSEAKGHVTQRLIDLAQTKHREIWNVRVAGPNAGHSAHTVDGIKMAFRQLPVGALRDSTQCVIAAGSEIEPEVLFHEIDQAIRYADFDPRNLFIDAEATLLEEWHKVAESDALLVDRIGSTGKGIGAARASRLLRTARRVIDDDALTAKLAGMGVAVMDTADILSLDDTQMHVIVEGTQGYGLGLHAGYYPYCTSSDCRAIDFLAMAGISPWWYSNPDLRVWAVARVFPIRVAGNSGPLTEETTWDALGLEPEYTTVTKKMRRVGQWDEDLVLRAVSANGGAPVVRLAITMLDQKFPKMAGVTTVRELDKSPVIDWIGDVEDAASADVKLVTTGPNTGVWL